jgi:hypothetical protein
VLLGVVKFVPAPALFMWSLLGVAKLPGAGTISALVAIVFILAGVFTYGVLKTRADEAERLMKLAREEAEIEREARDRLEKEVTVLRAQPNLEQHARLMQKLLDKSDIQIELLREIKTATVPPQ